MSQVVKDPTRVTKTTTTLLDHIFVSCTRNVSEISVPKFNISDHYPTGITWKIKSTSRLLNRNGNNHCTIKYRKQPDFDILKILVFNKIYKFEDTNDLDKKHEF